MGVIGTSMLIGAVNVVLFTALATLGAFIYNVCADLVGGIELTLASATDRRRYGLWTPRLVAHNPMR